MRNSKTATANVSILSHDHLCRDIVAFVQSLPKTSLHKLIISDMGKELMKTRRRQQADFQPVRRWLELLANFAWFKEKLLCSWNIANIRKLYPKGISLDLIHRYFTFRSYC